MPAGIFTWIFLRFFTLPVPPQVEHLCLISLPVPLQCWQVRRLTILPNGVFCSTFNWPEPLQCLQVSGFVPGFAPDPLHVVQVSSRGISISVSFPNAASSKETV